MINNKVSIIGLGFVGLPLAYCIAETGKYEVKGFDLSEDRIEIIKNKTAEIDDSFAKKVVDKTSFEVSTSPEIIKESEYIIICVPTPVFEDTKLPNLSPIISASEMILKYLEKGQKIILESTVNPGVSEEVIKPILEKTGLKAGQDFEVSHCPERINPGDPTWNIKKIPRNVGSISLEGNKIVADFYRSFIDAEINELSTIKASEATKIIENTFRDINIAYVNELAKSFDIMGIDLVEVITAASNKPYAFMAHFPGCGVGGHCIPVDPYYLIDKAAHIGFEHSFLKKAREVNNSMPAYTIDLLEQKLFEQKRHLKDTKIGVLGLSYKPNVPDLRESPSTKIIEILKEKACDFKTFDPHFPKMSSAKSLEEVLDTSDTIIIVTAHNEFKNLSGETLKKHNVEIVIDGRNCLNKEDLLKNNIIYKGIGR
ncbi:MAG: nucleotide sugar dehydrogenase [Candidatus Gracilibacteria bacterium]|jgi:nucleotide sugar dehydrogenase|nr:nucleotide sugar dehydrogenase [Candidatus Gracilibacteria bacterium]